MRRPETIERLYIDFDGFFASVMQLAMPRLRGRPVGVIPFGEGAADSTAMIACSKEAKAAGCHNVMTVPQARAICPDIVFVEQRPDLFRRVHNMLLSEISCEIPLAGVKSIDEVSCRLDKADIAAPHDLAARIKRRLRVNVGEQITCSMGFAGNLLLAKMACKRGKPDGAVVWSPDIMPQPLLALPLDDIPGIGSRMKARLNRTGIWTPKDVLATQPKQLRTLWRNVNGERLWYALHGYALESEPTERRMFGHARVLPPEMRRLSEAGDVARHLMLKAARRMRREGWYANRLWVWLDLRDRGWVGEYPLPCVHDDHACVAALKTLWEKASAELPASISILRVGVTLGELTPSHTRQLDLLLRDSAEREKWERITTTIDTLNLQFGRRVVTMGPWNPPGKYVGGKIAYTHVPSAEDFW